MAKVFLDTNIFLDIAYRKIEIRKLLNGNETCISSLSIHILCYVNKIKIPNQDLHELLKDYNLVSFTKKILESALDGPTRDFEDNIQLHSAAVVLSDVFLTSDKTLLNMKFFGKTKITTPQEFAHNTQN